MVKTVEVLVMSFAAVSDSALAALSSEKLVIDPLEEVRLKLFKAVMSEKFLFKMSLLAVSVTLFPTIEPELLMPPLEVMVTSFLAKIVEPLAILPFLNYLWLSELDKLLERCKLRRQWFWFQTR